MTAELDRQCAEVLPTFPRLDPGQEAGEECVVCWRPDPAVRVGVNQVGESVYACATPCAWQLGFRPEDGWQGGRA